MNAAAIRRFVHRGIAGVPPTMPARNRPPGTSSARCAYASPDAARPPARPALGAGWGTTRMWGWRRGRRRQRSRGDRRGCVRAQRRGRAEMHGHAELRYARRPAPPDAVVRLRHELRTPLAHTLGHSELLRALRNVGVTLPEILARESE